TAYTVANAALPKAGGALTGAVTTNSTFDGRNVSVDGTKLDTIATSANNYVLPYAISESATANTIVKRQGNGYIFGNYINMTANDVSSGVTKVMVETGNDNYMRHGSAAAVRTFINVENGATADQSAAEILTAIKTVDGTGSGLDADTLDGVHLNRLANTKSYGTGNITYGTTDQWYSLIADFSESESPITLYLKSDAHSSCVAVISRGYLHNNVANINILASNYTQNGGYPGVSGIRVFKATSGVYKIQVRLSFTNASVTSFGLKCKVVGGNGSYDLPTFETSLAVDTTGGSAVGTAYTNQSSNASSFSTVPYVQNNAIWHTGTLTTTNKANYDTAVTVANAALPKAGGTMTGALVGTTATFIANAAAGTNALNILGLTNGNGAGITFSDNGSPGASASGQNGYMYYYHGDGQSYGSGNTFVLSSSETTTTILADGKLMYKEGIYSKPSSGTGAGTRKDANWDTAYGWGNHALAGYTNDQTAAEILAALKTVDVNGTAGVNAGTVDGFTASSAATASTVAVRDSSADIKARLFRSEYASTNSTTNYIMTQVATGTGDNYIRPSTPAQIRAGLGIEAGATADQTAAQILTAIKTVDGAGSGLDADLLDGVSSASFLRSDTADDSYRISQAGHGVPVNNLGSPSLSEMALHDEQFNNKTEFYPIANLKFYTSTDGSTWTEYTSFSDTNKRKFLGGDASSGIVIPNGTAHFRIELINNGSYVFLNSLYMYWSSNSHNTTVKIRKQRGDGVWSQHTNSANTVSSWPGHLYLPFTSIAFHPSTTSTGHHRTVHFDFQPTWSTGSYSTYDINLSKFQVWGGYPAGKRNVYGTDENKNVTFPEVLAATGGNSTNWNTAYTVANAALPKAGGALTGAVTTNSTFDGRNVSV
ncbi:MAG: hypothetical protein ACKVJK_14570, partial [Methylophagaceae bacterium]